MGFLLGLGVLFGWLRKHGDAGPSAASGEVRLGRTASLEAPIENQVSADNPDPARHRMVQAPSATDAGLAFAADRISMNVHGNADSHIDALCHQAEDLHLHGGVAIDASVQTSTGFTEHGIDTVVPLVARGVLLDVAGALGVERLPDGHAITVEVSAG